MIMKGEVEDFHLQEFYEELLCESTRKNKFYTMPPTFVSCRFISKTFCKMEIGHNRGIRHLHISHNAPYSTPKFCITFVFHFSWVLQPSRERLKNTMLMQNLGGGGANKVHYGKCGSGVWLIMAPD